MKTYYHICTCTYISSLYITCIIIHFKLNINSILQLTTTCKQEWDKGTWGLSFKLHVQYDESFEAIKDAS